MDLAQKLRAVSAEVRQKRRFATNEASTRNYLIDPFVRALGYRPDEPDEVEPEFTADFVAGNRKVDYALKKDGKPIIFVEFKTATKNLSFDHTMQLQHYFSTKLDVRFGILTNGLEYRFYADIDNPNVMDDKPFLVVEMLNWNGKQIQELAAFSKSGFVFEGAMSTARQLKYGDEIRQRIEREMNQPSRDIIKYLARDLYSGSFSNKVVQEFAPIIRRVWQQMLHEEIPKRIQPIPNDVEDESKEVIPIPDPGEAIEIPIHALYMTRRLNAKLTFVPSDRKRSVVQFGDKTYKPSPSTLPAMKTVNPQINNQQNGWKFWKLRDPKDNQERPISDLREDDALLQRLDNNT